MALPATHGWRRVLFAIASTALMADAATASAAEPAPGESAAIIDAFHFATAYASPLRGLKIDGDLGDWPAGLPTYPILNVASVSGPGHLDDADLVRGPDLSASFRVAYDPDEHLVYVAAVVRDNVHVAGPNEEADAMRVYLTARPVAKGELPPASPEPDPDLPAEPVLAAPLRREPPVVVYAGVAAGGVPQEPRLAPLGAPPGTTTRTRFASSRQGLTTTYEWALECFDRFPGRMTNLAPGARLGFDVAILDPDAAGPESPPAAWACWGPAEKAAALPRLGILVLMEEGQPLASVRGTVTRKADGGPLADLLIVAGDKAPAGLAITDEHGNYELRLPAGGYRVRPASLQAIENAPWTGVTARAALPVILDLSLAPASLPPALAAAADAYANLRSYQDRVSLQVNDEEDKVLGPPLRLALACVRPDRARLSYALAGAGTMHAVADGREVACIQRSGAPFWRAPLAAPVTAGTLSIAADKLRGRGLEDSWRGNLMARLFVYRLALSPDPRREVSRGMVKAEELGEAVVEGEPCVVVELTKQARHVYRLFAGAAEAVVKVQLSISKRDHLIRKVAYTIDEPIVPGSKDAKRAPVGESVEPGLPRDRSVSCVATHAHVQANAQVDADVFLIPAPPATQATEPAP